MHTSRERINAVLNHQKPDHVPLDLGGTPVTGMHASSVYKLRQALKLDPPSTPVKIVDPYQLSGEIGSMKTQPGKRLCIPTARSYPFYQTSLRQASIDILNPIQWTAKNMEPQKLKNEFGDQFVFWGGGVDTQGTLPFGTPNEVQEEVKKHL